MRGGGGAATSLAAAATCDLHPGRLVSCARVHRRAPCLPSPPSFTPLPPSRAGAGAAHETHEVALRKTEQMARLMNAFGFAEEGRVGDAFNRELQEQKRQQMIDEREAKEREKK